MGMEVNARMITAAKGARYLNFTNVLLNRNNRLQDLQDSS
jgi:hypothetical protein